MHDDDCFCMICQKAMEQDAPSLDEVFPPDYEDIPEPKPQLKWQPVMLILPKRLECKCGVLAIFVTMTESEEEGEEDKRDMDYKGWCQECFTKAQEEETEEE